MDAAARDDFEAQPDDGELITRGEHRRMIHVFHDRLSKLEALCFEDAYEDDGKTIKRPSLEHLLESAHKHISVMCTYARAFKRIVIVVGSIGTAIVTVHEVLQFLGLL